MTQTDRRGRFQGPRRAAGHVAGRPTLIDARPGRLTAAGLAMLVLLVLATAVLVLAGPARASVWVIPASARAFPTTHAGSVQKIAYDAAGNEFEGFQVVVRGGTSRSVTLSWGDGSDPVVTDTTTLARVYCVRIKRPSSFVGGHKGLYPDPLVPRAFGAAMSVPANTTAFYLLTHVPAGTPAGDHLATLHVVNGSETADLPLTLHVWAFDLPRISTHSAFALNSRDIKTSLRSSGVHVTGKNKDRIHAAYYQMMLEHGIVTSAPMALPSVSGSGHIDESAYASDLGQFVGASTLDLPDTRLPWLHWFPWNTAKYKASSPKLLTYLTEVCRVLKDNGWQKKGYAYILDETMRTSEERAAERYARVLHKASARSGFRARFLLTDDPRPKPLTAAHRANKFLYDDVDVWAPRYIYFFGRYPALRERQRAGKEIFWYFYLDHFSRATPSFVIEKAPTDERVLGWLMYEWNVDGLLNYGLNDWAKSTTNFAWRDPYKNPLSLNNPTVHANGDTCLIYPGYYPRYGLDDPYAPPVSSLRFEALRDGFEEREYLNLAAATGSGAAAFVNQVVSTITWYPYTIRQSNTFHFPKYTKSVSVFARARKQLAERIEAYQP